MARKISKKDNRYLARLVTGERAPCAFCLREVDDEITYGKLYAIGDIQCHYFCCLLSCCLIQKGHDEEGLFGFMYSDILAEVERCKKHKCSYCGRNGANLGCSVGACRKQFHVPCGRDRNAVSLYYGSYKSFCQQHAPRQKIPEHILAKARLRIKVDKSKTKLITASDIKLNCDNYCTEEMVCVICYEPVDGFPSVNTFWPPCCGKDAWFHRTCLQRMALSAGMHYLKCPLCNDKESFYDAVVEQGYYVPDRDAAWELEQNAFAEIYERPATCSAEPCLCPLGRSHDAENGKWDIKLCLLCGSAGAHAQCIDQSQLPKRGTLPLDQSNKTQSNPLRLEQSEKITNTFLDQSEMREEKNLSIESNGARIENLSLKQSKYSDESNTFPDNSNSLSDNSNTFPDNSNTSPNKSNTCDNSVMSIKFVCRSCLPAAPEDLETLALSIEALIQQEQAQSTAEVRRPVMPGRMSIRRTKGRRAIVERPSSSRSSNRIEADKESTESPNIRSSRLELSLKTPRRVHCEPEPVLRSCAGDSKLLSPLKLLEQSFREKMVCTGVRDAVLDETVVETLRRKFRKPRPMCEKKRLVNNILDGFFDDLMKGSKQKEQVIKWCSPKKCYNLEESKELKSELNESPKHAGQGQNKENIVNTFNTPSKDTRNNKIEDIATNQFDRDDNKLEEPFNVKECQTDDANIKNTDIPAPIISYENNDDYFNNSHIKENDTITDGTQTTNITDPCRLSKNVTNYQYDNDISRKLSEASCDEEINLGSQTNIRNNIERLENSERKVKNEIVEAPPKNASEHSNKANKVSSELNAYKNSGNKDIENDEIINATKNDSLHLEREINKRDKFLEHEKQPYKDKPSKKFLSLKRKHSKKHKRRTHKGVQKPKHSDSKNLFINKQKVRSKSESSTDINLLKRLAEKDMYSQFLLELTTGKVNEKHLTNKSSVPQKTINEAISYKNETPKYKTSKRSSKTEETETTPRSSKEKKESSQTPNSSHKTQNDLKQRTSIPKDSKHSNVSPKFLIKRRTSLDTPKPLDQLSESLIKLDDTPNNVIDTPKHKTIEIQQDSSLEISGNNQHINIDVIKIENQTNDSYKTLKILLPEQRTCSDYSTLEETVDKNDIGLDLETFKKEYLNEVDRQFKCSFKHKHVEKAAEKRRYSSPIDFALEAANKKGEGQCAKKRKFSESGVKLLFDNSVVKKRKTSESDLKLFYDYDTKVPEKSKDLDKEIDNTSASVENNESKTKIKHKHRKEKRKAKRNKRTSLTDKEIEVTIDSSEKRSVKNKKIKKKIKTKFAIRNENIQVKIKWKKERFSLNIESKKQTKKEKKVKDDHSKLKQYVLQFPEGSSKEVLVKPEKEVCPLKRKYIRNEKSPDNLRQMSIQSFFKLKSEK